MGLLISVGLRLAQSVFEVQLVRVVAVVVEVTALTLANV